MLNTNQFRAKATITERLVHRAAQETTVSTSGLSDELRQHAVELCEFFQIPYGSLIRTALPIQNLDRAERIEKEHLQEAAQHLVIRDE